MRPILPVTLAILAGGQSSRMNYRNKAFLSYQEKTFVERLIEAGSDFEEVIIVANTKEAYENFNLQVVSDVYPGKGPLSGIHAALRVAKTSTVLCVACDMPLTSREVLNGLAQISGDYDVLVPEYEGRLQPLCAIYSKKIKNKVEEQLKKDDFKLQYFIRQLNYQVIRELPHRPFKSTDFLNVNTPTDLSELEEM